jgi:hypothetical protein
VFTAGNGYFWVPLVACPLGGVIGSILYKLMIEMHWPAEDKSDEKSEYLVPQTSSLTVKSDR